MPSCAEAGVLGVLPGNVGSLQGVETIRLILGPGNPMIGRLLLFDALEMEFTEVKIRRSAACPVCGDSPTITRLIDYDQFGVPHRNGHQEAQGVQHPAAFAGADGGANR